MKSNIAHYAWLDLLGSVLTAGATTSPRGQETKELLSKQTLVDMRYPIVVSKERKLGYKFMAAEAAWILSGDNRVSTIKDFAKHIKDFSDDGIQYFGAYGPRFRDQVRHVVRSLEIDRDSRQAVVTLWRSNPPETKDVPCTISLHWMIRDDRLHCFADMRSSDVWLGVPYDWFNFSMMSTFVLLQLRERQMELKGLGTLHFVAHSQHLYARNFENASKTLLNHREVVFKPHEFIPWWCRDHDGLIELLWSWAKEPKLMREELDASH